MEGPKRLRPSTAGILIAILALFLAIAETGATLAFDAIGGGEMTSIILNAMEAVAARSLDSYNRYGSSTMKQVYIYGGLNMAPTEISRGFGMKWGVGGWLLTRALAQEGARAGITVNVVAPGVIEGAMAGAQFPPEAVKQLVPAARAGRPEEVAALVAFLCSDAAGYVNGQVIGVNGAAARLVQKNDKVIVVTYGQLPQEEARQWNPNVVLLDDANEIKNAG